MEPGFTHQNGQVDHFLLQHGFPTGQHEMLAIQLKSLLNDFRDLLVFALRCPAGVRGITEATPEIAPRGAHEDALGSRQQTFTLNRFVNFTD